MSNLLEAQTYRLKQVNSGSPLDILLMTYEAALSGCDQRDFGRTTRALNLLSDALDFSYDRDIATGFFKLYQYCADLVRDGEYDETALILVELRDTWAQVKAQYQPKSRVTCSSTLRVLQPTEQPQRVAAVKQPLLQSNRVPQYSIITQS